MITKNELNNVVLSPTKKDYYQIWNELLDLASKISDRWTPEETNESDPGIVLLKALTAIADKLNYNIDKNTLEAFMPSATQEESMRKLTEMMGYNMKYYQSATCKVRIDFKEANDLSWKNFATGIYFPKFVNLTNEDEDINYVTLESFRLYENEPYRSVYAIEGELVTCEGDADNVISIALLDDNNRYYLPEFGVAENGIFVSNISDNIEEELWEKVDSLNTRPAGAKVFKFGYDSNTRLPYVQFPDDISHIINRGVKIQYIRTSGINGNTSAGNLSKMNIPSEWSNVASEDSPFKKLSEENFKIKQLTPGSNGANPESIDSAYNNYKKTVGTFDTLVTCRDYMNKIYQMTVNENSSTPLVSNIIVSDIRDDINNAITLCSFNNYGISYSNKSLLDENNNNKIDHCDLILYPFKTIYGLNDEREYKNSFKYDASNNNIIESELSELKTASHNFKTPGVDDIVCIKNYLKLKAQIYTYKKVTTEECRDILSNVRKSIYEKFNARQLDFGEEIPYDSIFNVMLNADSRIKDINLDEPILSTKICTKSDEYLLTGIDNSTNANDEKAKRLYNKLVLRNVLAGRIAAFDYENSFSHDYRDVQASDYSLEYGPNPNGGKYISKLKSEFEVTNNLSTAENNGIKLKENQVIQFRMPNLRTEITYPAYVNYYLHLANTSSNTPNYPATMISFKNYIQTADGKDKFKDFLTANTSSLEKLTLSIASDAVNKDDIYNNKVKSLKEEFGLVLIYNSSNELVEATAIDNANATNGKYDFYVLPFNSSTLGLWNSWVTDTLKLSGIYKNNGVDLNKTPGYLIDVLKQSYSKITTTVAQHNVNTLSSFYIPITHDSDDTENKTYTADGLGRNGRSASLSINSEYELDDGEYLLINYTDSTTDSNNVETKTVKNIYYGPGKIIRPNFELVDSASYSAGHSYTKKDGFSFVGEASGNPKGMFTLGTNEQIEIRQIAKVKLDGIVNLYWILKSDNLENTTNEFKFNEKYSDNDINAGEDNNAYTLKEGEYLFYTDQNKTDFAYYGAGSVIVKTDTINKIQRITTNDTNISIDSIEQNWIASDIPWTTYNWSDKTKAIYVVENQYVSLTNGDTLNFASKDLIETSSYENALSLGVDKLSNDWLSVQSARYTFANGTSETLPRVNITGINWKIRSRLDFNMSQSNPQTLHAGDKITAMYNDDTEVEDFCGSNDNPLTIQPNSLCLGVGSEIDVTERNEILDGEINSVVNKNFKLKVSNREEIRTKDGSTLALNNYVNNDQLFTNYRFIENSDLINEDFALNISIPINNFGLVMFYWNFDDSKFTTDTSSTSGKTLAEAKIAAYDNDNNLVAKLSRLNDTNSSEKASEIKLKHGFNMIKVEDSSVTKIKVYGNCGNIIFDNLKVIKDVNPLLDYQSVDKDASENYLSSLKQIMSDIKKYGAAAQDFYYTTPIAQSTAIEVNPLVANDTLLKNPLTWYDTNNINNKFVISKIDTDSLKSGITIARSSRV